MPTLNQWIRHVIKEKPLGGVMYMYAVRLESTTFQYFSSVPLIKGLPTEVKALLFWITKFFLIYVISRTLVMIGYLLMEDLSSAIAQFYPGFSGRGGSSTPPGGPGPGQNWELPLASGVGTLEIEDEIDQDSIWNTLDAQEQADLIEPLMSDAQRRMELEEELQRMIDNQIMKPLSRAERKNLLEMQFACEKKIEKALRSDGYRRETLFCFRREWRRAAFSPNTRSTFVKSTAMQKTMAKHSDIKTTIYYKRVLNEIGIGGIHLKKTD